MLTTPSSSRIEHFANHLSLSFDDCGSGSPVLVLHGGGGPRSVASFVQAMSSNARVLAPTHPGFGDTARPSWFTGIDDLADAAVALLDRLGLDDVLVVGFSMGGWIACEVALRAQSRLRGLVLVDAVGIEVEAESIVDVFTLTPRGLADLSYHDPDRYALDPATLSPEQRESIAGNFRSLATYCGERNMRDPGLRDRLGNISIRTLVAWGASDRIVTARYGQAFAAAIPQSRFELIEECGHLPQIEQPQRLLALVRDFDSA